jgi:two-component system nitrogen regulation response regulator NtrX
MMATAERDMILRALEANSGQVSRTASELQVERSHLYKKMRSLGIDPKSVGTDA